MKLRLMLIVVLGLMVAWLARPVEAEADCGNDLGCLENQVKELSKSLELSKAATAPLESEVKRLDGEINSIQRQINAAESRLEDLVGTIQDREEDLAVQYLLLSEKTKEHYKRLRSSSGLMVMMSLVGTGGVQQELGYREVTVNQDRVLIASLAGEIGELEQDKIDVEASKVRLASLQVSLDKEAEFFRGEVAGAKAYQSDLQGEISTLQSSILAAKSGSFISSVGDSELADDYNASVKGFREAAPAGSFSLFSFGAYTHRRGMSQYGARGRANNGKSYDEILRAYYDFDGYEDRGSITIRVNNSNAVNGGNVIWSGSLEEYVKRIYEVPGSWPAPVLEAQAIAARSYVLAVTGNGAGTICGNEHCQAFKTGAKGGDWGGAVDSTSGKVMVLGGQAVKAFYSSTAGGYSFTKGWDTTDGSGGSNFFDKSYEKLGGSPWAYKAWYRKGYTSSGATCEKGNPWLNNEEFTDVVNAAIVMKNGGDDRVTPVTTSCWGGNPYSYAELKSLGGVSSVSSVTVIQGNGETGEVVINGSVHLSGVEFKKGFNVRAPGYLRIPQGSGFGSSVNFAFFDIESK